MNLHSIAQLLCSRPWCSLLPVRCVHELELLQVRLSVVSVFGGVMREVFDTTTEMTDAHLTMKLFKSTLKAATGSSSCAVGGRRFTLWNMLRFREETRIAAVLSCRCITVALVVFPNAVRYC